MAHRGLFERFELGERLPLLLEDPSDGDSEFSESTSPVVVVVEFPFILAVKLDVVVFILILIDDLVLDEFV